MADRLAIGRSYVVLPVVVSAPSPDAAVERADELMDRLASVVGAFGGAEVVSNLAECLEACEYAVQMCEARIRAAVAEKARNQ